MSIAPVAVCRVCVCVHVYLVVVLLLLLPREIDSNLYCEPTRRQCEIWIFPRRLSCMAQPRMRQRQLLNCIPQLLYSQLTKTVNIVFDFERVYECGVAGAALSRRKCGKLNRIDSNRLINDCSALHYVKRGVHCLCACTWLVGCRDLPVLATNPIVHSHRCGLLIRWEFELCQFGDRRPCVSVIISSVSSIIRRLPVDNGDLE